MSAYREAIAKAQRSAAFLLADLQALLTLTPEQPRIYRGVLGDFIEDNTAICQGLALIAQGPDAELVPILTPAAADPNTAVPCLRFNADWTDGYLVAPDTEGERYAALGTLFGYNADGTVDLTAEGAVEPGMKLIVERIAMTQSELDALPEFEG